MAYFRIRPGKPWHIAIPWKNKGLCNVSAGENAFFVKALRTGEVLCENCASLEARSVPKPPKPYNPWTDPAPMERPELLATPAQVYKLRDMGYTEEQASIMSRGEAHSLIGEYEKTQRLTR